MSSTLGSPTKTGWKRRSSAASFSMYWRYSSRVVAPTTRSSPRASAGFSMFPASGEPSVFPAPTIVCSSSMKTTNLPSASEISFSTAFSRSSNSPRYFAPASMAPMSREITRLVAQPLRDVAGDHPLRQPLDDGGLPHPGLADEHRVVLRAAGEDLHHPPDLLVPADHRVELPAARALRKVGGEALQRLVLLLRVLVRHPVAATHLLERLQEGVPAGALRRQQLPRRRALLLGQREQQVLRRYVLVLQVPRLHLRAIQDLVQLARERRLRASRLLREPLHRRVDLLPEPGDVHPHLLQHRHDDPLRLRQERAQQVNVLHAGFPAGEPRSPLPAAPLPI